MAGVREPERCEYASPDRQLRPISGHSPASRRAPEPPFVNVGRKRELFNKAH